MLRFASWDIHAENEVSEFQGVSEKEVRRAQYWELHRYGVFRNYLS
jgi:hypothetical protein